MIKCARCKYLYIDKLAPCIAYKILLFRYFDCFRNSCNFEPEFYADKSASRAASTASNMQQECRFYFDLYFETYK